MAADNRATDGRAGRPNASAGETVSVVIPAHNAAGTLAAAVRSAADQRPPPLEIIVVDDGSTDGTAAVAAGLPEVRLVGQPQAGPSAARNRGVAEARGGWVGFLDADDSWLPDKLRYQLRAAAGQPDVVLVATDWVREPGGAPTTGDRYTARQPTGLPVREVDYRQLLTLNRFQTSTVIARTAVLRRLGGFDQDLDGAEDWDMWLRCAGEGRILRLPIPLVVYRDQTGGYSKDLPRVYRTMLAMLAREQRRGRLSQREYRRLLAWHHERFAVGFVLNGQRTEAVRALRRLRTEHLLTAAPGAAVGELLPFLAGRVRRRWSSRHRAAAADHPVRSPVA